MSEVASTGSWPHVGVVGGSLGGLTAALVLRDLGREVDVFERTRARTPVCFSRFRILETS